MSKSHKDRLLTQLREVLSSRDKVIFAYAFGSFVEDGNFRDIDIGVYFQEPYMLHDVGLLQSDLQYELDKFLSSHPELNQIVADPMDPFSGTPIDLVILNNLPHQNPVLSQDIINKGQCLKEAENRDTQVNFILLSLRHFEDTRYIRAISQEALLNRIKTNRIGERNYES